MYKLLFLLSALLMLFSDAQAQITEGFITLKRGMLWETVGVAKMGPVFQNWERLGYGMDYPGFDPQYIPRNVGGANTHHHGGGFWIGARRPSAQDTVWGVIDWALFATSVGSSRINSQYMLKKHTLRWPDGENYWLQTDPGEAEEVIDTEWELNPEYKYPYTPPRFMPVRVKRTVRTWSGSKQDEKYIIIDYVIINISREPHIFNAEVTDPAIYRVLQADSVLQDLTLLFTYSFSINNRAWNVLFPQYGNGAQNNRFLYDSRRRLIYGWADDFAKEQGNQKFAPYFYPTGGPPGGKEWLAPSYAGLQFLFISPNKNNQANYINQVGWTVSEPANTYPLSNIEATELRFQAMRDISLGYKQPMIFPQGLNDDRWQQSRLWTVAGLGPWDLAPGDSIRIVTAELAGSIDYHAAFDPNTTEADIARKGLADIQANADRAQFNFDHEFDVPDPPAAPSGFTLQHLSGQKVGNQISWTNEAEDIPDTDYSGGEALDLAGYRIYRSQYLPFGPYLKIAEVPRNDARFFNEYTNTYTFIDTMVKVGYGYYYAISSYDSGHDSWPVDPGVRFPETGSNAVPSMESSFYPNHSFREPFLAAFSSVNSTLDSILVVPNPFVRSSGISTAGSQDIISFNHVPAPCTIKIYTLIGDLVRTIDHRQNIGVVQWDQITDYGQFAESGVYLYHVTSHAPASKGKTIIGKFAIVR